MKDNLIIDYNLDFDKFNNYELILNMIIIIFGFIIGLLIGYLTFNSNTYIGPDSNEISKKIYVDSEGKRYKWIPKVCICPINLSMGKLKNPNYKDPNHLH